MNITEHGLQSVAKSYNNAQTLVKHAREELKKAEELLALREKQLNCPHPEDMLHYKGGIQLVETVCEKCGFTWMD